MPEVVMQHVYKLPWETIARAYLSRYPQHPNIPMMLAQELTAIDWNAATDTLTVTRRMKADLEAPYWLKRLFGVYHAYMWQEHTIDFAHKKMTTVSHSNPASKFYKAGEVATWEPDPQDPEHCTLFRVRAFLELTKFFLNVQSVIENFLMRSFQSNFDNARKIDMVFVELLERGDAARSEKLPQRTLLEESVSSWIERSLRVQKAANIAAIVPFALTPATTVHHDIEIGPIEGKQL